jgi:hypothetical protein
MRLILKKIDNFLIYLFICYYNAFQVLLFIWKKYFFSSVIFIFNNIRFFNFFYIKDYNNFLASEEYNE